jgi:two-component system CheB/CheR fusion protein
MLREDGFIMVVRAKSTRKGSKTVIKDNPQSEERERESGYSFFVAGLGASAGGIEAFEKFFKNLSPDTGIAFVIVMHLDPHQKGFLPETIQRFSKMPVQEARDDMKVEPDNVYVIPSNKDMVISGDVLKLAKPVLTKGLRMPIDTFFRSLADDHGEKSIGIIFSGMGSDGTLGLKAIKENMGMVMAQDPKEAEYDNMILSAINTGTVDFVAPAADLPRQLQEYTRTFPKVYGKTPIIEGKEPTVIDNIILLVRAKTGHDFSYYKKATIYRRIERRMGVNQITEIPDYVKFLKQNPAEVDLLFKDLLIGVTSFFREPEAFEALEKSLKSVLAAKPEDVVIRAWVPGCSTGEEAYSIAMVISEALGKRKNKIQIFATDIDDTALETARKGIYPDNITADVSPERLKRFFVKENNLYRVKKELREKLLFAEQDVIVDPPFTNLDLVSCRNLLIYLTQGTQLRVLSTFAYSLNPDGILFLGPSESIGALNDAFITLDSKQKVFKRREYLSKRELTSAIRVPLSNPLERVVVKSRKPEPGITEDAQQAILDSFSPPAVLIKDDGEIVYFGSRTGKYLEPSPGKASMNIFTMARAGLKAELGVAVDKAKREKKEVVSRGVEVKTNDHKEIIDLIVKPVNQPESLLGMLLVAFQSVEQKKATKHQPKNLVASDRCNELQEQLEYSRQKLRTTMEDMNASQEELRSMNEELQSTNEELQSTNEELTTSKEEMQSLNEELNTVNTELQSKMEDLTRNNNDMRNLLQSTSIATLFLDNDLHITRYTPEATKLYNMRASDLGRPITDISTNIQDENIKTDLKQVLETLVPIEKEVQVKGQQWYLMRITPYRTTDNVIKGLVITFNDITSLKILEKQLTDAKKYAESIINTMREPLIVLEGSLKVVTANPAFYKRFEVKPGETEGQLFFNLGNGQWNIPSLKTGLTDTLRKKQELNDYVVEHDFPKIGHVKMLVNARKLLQEEGKKELILLSIETVNNDKCD